ncbi:hypothetical protein VB005_08181 [Metarhizium brunneum]
MRYSIVFAASLAARVSGHGLIRSIEGANGVSMPGLTVADGTPRDCTNNPCGSQADTAIIRDVQIKLGKCGPLGQTQGHGSVNASAVVANFMGTGGPAPVNKRPDGALGTIGVVPSEDNSFMTPEQRREEYNRQAAELFKGESNDVVSPMTPYDGAGKSKPKNKKPPYGVEKAKGKGKAKGKAKGVNKKSSKIYRSETLNGDMRGQGAETGLPTCNDEGVINLIYHQINEDGAGPLDAAIDCTSGGSDASAFQPASVIRDIPGSAGISSITNTDHPVQVQMPAGMTCNGEVAGVKGVCIVRVRNTAGAGPFGGSAAFTQSQESRKRAIAYRLQKRMEIGSSKSH